MDYMMLKHFFKCVAENKPMSIDVYDAVAWMSYTALSEQSIELGSMPIKCPDFTRESINTESHLTCLNFQLLKVNN